MTDAEKVERLRAAIKARECYGDFPNSLVDQFDRKGRLSDRQMFFVDKLYNERKIAAPAAIVRLGRIQAMFAAARERSVAEPKLYLTTATGRELELTPNQKFAGSINIKDRRETRWNAKFQNESKVYYGYITASGEYNPHGNAPDILPALESLALDPVEAARLYGHKTSSCMFCGIKLRAGASTTVGYGPVCASNYGLPWGKVDPVTWKAEIDAELAANPPSADMVSPVRAPTVAEQIEAAHAEVARLKQEAPAPAAKRGRGRPRKSSMLNADERKIARVVNAPLGVDLTPAGERGDVAATPLHEDIPF